MGKMSFNVFHALEAFPLLNIRRNPIRGIVTASTLYQDVTVPPSGVIFLCPDGDFGCMPWLCSL